MMGGRRTREEGRPSGSRALLTRMCGRKSSPRETELRRDAAELNPPFAVVEYESQERSRCRA